MGNISGTAVPQVNGPSPSGYTQPAFWGSPAVSGRDLIVHSDVLRQVAGQLSALGDQLRSQIAAWDGPANQAASGGAMGSWPEAQQLAGVVLKAYSGVGSFTGALQQAHGDTATRLSMSADKYDATEQHLTKLINAASDPSATIVQGGGNDVPVDPGYGQNWTPAERAGYYRVLHMEQMGGGGENWTGTYPITEDATFSPATTTEYTWQEVQGMLEATDPDAITAAGAAYGQLSQKLTDVAGQLSSHGQTLASNWGGTTAVTAVSQVQQLYQTAADMQANTWQAQQSLTWYGPVLAAFKSSAPQATSTHPADVKAANKAANQHMAALNGHMQTAFYNMPGAVNKNLPPALAGSGGSGTSGGVGSGGGGGSAPSVAGGGRVGAGGAGSVPGVTGVSPSVPGVSNPGSPRVGHLSPGVPAGSVPAPGGQPSPTSLAGVQPGGPGTITPVGTSPSGPGGLGTPPPVVSPGGGGGGGVGVVPPVVSPGGGGSGSGGSDPSELNVGVPGGVGTGDPGPVSEVSGFGDPPVISPTGMITGQTVPGESLATSGDAAMGSDALGAQGGFPMMGGMQGGTSQSGAGRDRESWTTEDEGTWGPETGSDGATADPLSETGMPGMMPFGQGSGQGGQDRDRSRQSWMAEEDDLWGATQPAIPPIIDQN